MRYILFLVFIFFFCGKMNGTSTAIYLLPGQGSDERIFDKLTFEQPYIIKHIIYDIPSRKMSLSQYARHLSQQIDTTEAFILIGVSLGGMIATEMADFLKPEKVIVISSAKSRNELPGRYTFQKYLPIYRLFPNFMLKWGALLLQPIVEPDRNKQKAIFKQMLKNKQPKFLKRTINMIVNWERKDFKKHIVPIHGNKDHTLPIKVVEYDYLIENGSHMMTLTRGEEISQLINQILSVG